MRKGKKKMIQKLKYITVTSTHCSGDQLHQLTAVVISYINSLQSIFQSLLSL